MTTKKVRRLGRPSQARQSRALVLLDEVLAEIQTETVAPVPLGGLDQRQFLETLREKLEAIREAAIEVA